MGRTLWGLSVLVISLGCLAAEPDGRSIVEQSLQRHHLTPYTFERQSLVLMDDKDERDVRKLRRYSRLEADGTLKYLLVFDDPPEVRGVALRAIRRPDGHIDNGVFLPALGRGFTSLGGEAQATPFLGSDFTVQDLAPEAVDDHRYRREPDQVLEEVPYYVVAARPMDKQVARRSGYSLRRLFIRKDNLFVARVDYYDRNGRFFKRRTSHDLRALEGGVWRADMILMEDFRSHHLSLLKVGKRVFSASYVPEEVFEPQWVLNGSHINRARRMAGPRVAQTGRQPERTESGDRP